MHALHERSFRINLEVYNQVLQRLPDINFTQMIPHQLIHSPPTGRTHFIYVTYALQPVDSRLQVWCRNALNAASFLDILLGIDISLAVETCVNDPDPHAALRRLVELANRF